MREKDEDGARHYASCRFVEQHPMPAARGQGQADMVWVTVPVESLRQGPNVVEVTANGLPGQKVLDTTGCDAVALYVSHEGF